MYSHNKNKKAGKLYCAIKKQKKREKRKVFSRMRGGKKYLWKKWVRINIICRQINILNTE